MKKNHDDDIAGLQDVIGTSGDNDPSLIETTAGVMEKKSDSVSQIDLNNLISLLVSSLCWEESNWKRNLKFAY